MHFPKDSQYFPPNIYNQVKNLKTHAYQWWKSLQVMFDNAHEYFYNILSRGLNIPLPRKLGQPPPPALPAPPPPPPPAPKRPPPPSSAIKLYYFNPPGQPKGQGLRPVLQDQGYHGYGELLDIYGRLKKTGAYLM